MPGAFLTADLSTFMSVGDFATQATVGVRSFPVVFDNGYQAALAGMVEATGPSCVAATADVAGVGQGDTITINSVAFKVTGVQPDGTGVTTLQLREA